MSELDTKPLESPVPADELDEKHLGLAGRTARFFIKSPLSSLFYLTMLLLGLGGLIITPRQEDPQISVPMIDIFVQYPGAAADEVASLAIQPLERIMSEIQGVKHVYSASERGQGVVTIQFEVGEDMESSLVKVNDQLASNMDKIPPGVSQPMVKAKGIDDVPIMTITLWSDQDYNRDGVPDVDDSQLRQLANSVLQSIKEIPETGEGFVVGGRAEQVVVEVYPERLTGFGISLGQVADAIQKANSEQQIGNVESSGAHMPVVTGAFLRTVDDINQLQVGNHNGVPVYVYDVASVRQGPEDANQMVAYYTGAASETPDRAISVPAVTVAVAKKKGTNGVSVANDIQKRVESLRGRLIPNDIEISYTRNYGQTADDKVKDLIFKLFIATFFVFLLVYIAFRALRPALVVLMVIPVVLLFTVFGAWILGFTIDRVSLFALIFSIGILVDDAIVVVENIYRRWLERGSTDEATAVDAVREVGNPTILATFTVIGALLPMGFVTGMMGPYMMPIPALGSVAMLISLFAAFVFTPWLAIHPWFRPSMHYLATAEKREHREAEKLNGFYRRILTPMIEEPRKARMFRLGMWVVFLLTCSFFYFKWVAVKMLPLDNKPEFAVVLDMPEGTALADTANRANQIANMVRGLPEVTAVQIYVGTARPYDFNGMVRHYYLRNQPWQAEVQVQLLHKRLRKRSSHEIAVETRAKLLEMMGDSGAAFAVVEMPPGPPVLQSVVAEVHGPDGDTMRSVARDLTGIFQQAESLRDVDNYMREPYYYWHFQVDREKADRRGISVETINQNLAMAVGGMVLGDVKQKAGHEPVNIVLQVPLAERSQISRLGDILVHSPASGVSVPLRELGDFRRLQEDDIIFHKDLRPVEYVVADVGGRLAAPVYGMFQVEDLLLRANDGNPYITPDGIKLADETYWTGPPPNDNKSGLEWAGEWTVTYETFRDMGLAFGAALVLIYILVVWEFGNFRIPALIMAPIPLTLLGIIPAHALFYGMGWGGEFTATSMIGWIALAGIIVRNSILLVDFSIHQVQRGVSVPEAVIAACKTRTRPIVITAFALVAGSSVIFFDPIFQGMAISLASGVLVSTVLTLIVIPLGCVDAAESLCEVAGVQCKKRRSRRPSGSESGGQGGASFLLKTWQAGVGAAFWMIRVVQAIAALIKSRPRAKPSPQKTPPAAAAPQKPAPAELPAGATEPKAVLSSEAGADDAADKAAVDKAAVDKAAVDKAAAEKAAAEKAAAEKAAAEKAAADKAAAEKAAAEKAATEKAAAQKAAAEKAAAEKAASEHAESVKQSQSRQATRAGAAKTRERVKQKLANRPGSTTKSAETQPRPPAKKAGLAQAKTGKGGKVTAAKLAKAAEQKGTVRRGIRLKSLDD